MSAKSRSAIDNPVIKTIVSLILWPFAWLAFVLGCTIILILMIVIPPRYLTPVVRLFGSIILLSSGIILDVRGKQNIDTAKTYLWMINHQSLYDVFIVASLLPGYAVGVEAAHQFDWPLWGRVVRRWGNIPIDRENLEDAKRSIEQAQETLKRGISILIAPEGTRTVTGRMGPFKKGPFHLALASKAEILPMGIRGAFEVKKKTDWRLRPGRVRVDIGKPLPYDQYRQMSVEALRDHVRERIQVLVGEVR